MNGGTRSKSIVQDYIIIIIIIIIIGQRRFTSGHRMVGGEEHATIMEEQSDCLHENQKHGRR